MENSDSKSFFSHVFDFEEHSKNEIMNICQYAILAIIPIILLNKTTQYLAPLPDSSKGTIEITFEIIFQIFVMFILLLLIHRMITYVPTYSGMHYKEINIIQIILVTLIFLFSFHTIISEKVNILVNRVIKYWDGNSSSNKKENMSNKKQGDKSAASSSRSSSDSYLKPVQPHMDPQQQAMASETFTTLDRDRELQNEQMMAMEPMAANSVLGGGSFGNANW